MPTIATLIDRVLMNKDDEKIITNARAEVNELMESFELFAV
jgi:glycine/serine hydroxymethyltransferase